MSLLKIGTPSCRFFTLKTLSDLGLALALLLLVGAPALHAQGIVTGTIAGTLQDPQGAAIAGAAVQAVDVATGSSFSAKSDSQGYFELRSLPIGSYNLTIEA